VAVLEAENMKTFAQTDPTRFPLMGSFRTATGKGRAFLEK